MVQNHSKEFWKNHIEACDASGSTQKEYCAKHQIALSTFCYWKRKLKRKISSKPTFYPLTIPSRSLDTETTGVIVTLGDGRFTIELEKGFSTTAFSKVAAILEGL